MALLQFGTTAGLAYRHNWDSVMAQQNYNEAADHQARIDAESKAMLLGDKLKFAHAANTWDNQLLKQFSEGRVREIGKFATENPDFMMNPMKWAQFNQLSDELTSNDIVYRSLRIQKNYEGLVDYIHKNPGSENDPDVQMQLQEYENYTKKGSVDGITANGKEYIFRSPDAKFDAQAAIAQAYINLKGDTTYDKRGVGIGATKTEVSQGDLQSTALGLLNGPNGWRFMRTWQAFTPEQKTFYGNDPVKWVSTAGSAYTPNSVHAGTVFKPESSGSGDGSGRGGKTPPYSPFLNDFGRMQPGGAPTFSNHVDKLLPVQNGKMKVDGDLRVPMTGQDGKMSWVVLKSYNGSLVDANPTGRVILGPTGEQMAEVVVKVPMTKELVKGETPLFNDNSYWFEGWDSNESNDTKEIDAMKGVARIEIGKDGKQTGNAILTTYVPTMVTQSSVRAYDDAASGQTNANKAEGMALNTLTANAILTSVVRTGTLPDGTKVGELPDGTVINMQTLQRVQ